MKKNTDDGAKIYTPLTLKLYDWWVLGVSNRLAWGCPTKEHLLPHFLEHLGNNHLDIGVGTGFYLTHVPESSLISLMDLNEASLNAASTRAGESKIKHKISHDVFEPYPAALHGQFDSISMFYLLHCLPGNISTKSCVIRNAAQALTDDGTLYGATILGDGVVHNSFGQKLMRIYNQKGIFSNTKDSEEGLTLMNPLMILVKIIKLRWIHILSYDQMVSRKINNQTTRCANSIFYTTLFTNSAPNYT